MANKERLNLLIELARHVAALIARALTGTVVTNEELAEAKAEANTWRKKLLSLTKTQAVDNTAAIVETIKEIAEDLDDSGEPVAADLEPRPRSFATRMAEVADKPANPALHASHRPVPSTSADELAAHQAVIEDRPLTPAPNQKTVEKLTGIVQVGTADESMPQDRLGDDDEDLTDEEARALREMPLPEFETPDPLDVTCSEDIETPQEDK